MVLVDSGNLRKIAAHK